MARLPCHMLINAQPAAFDSHQLEFRFNGARAATQVSGDLPLMDERDDGKASTVQAAETCVACESQLRRSDEDELRAAVELIVSAQVKQSALH
ncbi:hypothetical protein [Microvirga sp. BSC39]|uniref:hypothetical protein n=1 Tax=Microvirga sp. BSC39 TaxID=1549810 RepID=UPI0004E9124C|nr:hypothetical protein [Microvirga sp. BSC39]KFG69452.1 hypothetical protein JH26_11735 [Microvirga sp. BSC39]